jgi:hypothetical protein
LRTVGGDIVALVQHIELNESGWVDVATKKAVRFLFWLLDDYADSARVFELRDQVGLARLTLAQTEAAIAQLTADGELVSMGERYRLSEEARNRLSLAVSSAEAVEKSVVSKVVLSASAVTVHDIEDSAELWGVFRDEFVVPFIAEFGARAYELITGSATNVGQTEFIATFLAKFDGDRQKVLEPMILSLLDKNDQNCRHYILGLLNTYFYKSSLTLPDKAVRKITSASGRSRLRLILDTNFLFSLFKLHSNPSNEAVTLLIDLISKLPKQIEIKMYVLPTTINEFRKSLVYYENLAKNFRLTRSIVDTALQVGVSGVLETYFKRVRDAGYKLSAEDYFKPFHDNINALLAQHGVSTLSGEDDRYSQDQDTIDDVMDQMAFYKNKFINDPKRQKSYEQIWHDVLLWHFTFDRRPSISDTVFEAEWVGVTIDYGLIAFDGHKRKWTGIPVLVHPASLVQALQLLVPADENLERAILALMQMPFLFEPFDLADERVTQKILGSLSRFENIDDLSTETIVQVLGNRALRGKIEVSASKDEEVALIRDAIIAHASEVEKRARDAELRLSSALTEREEIASRLGAAERQRREDAASREISQIETAREIESISRQNQILAAKLAAAEEAEALRAASRKQRTMYYFLLLATTLFSAAACIVTFIFRDFLSANIISWAPFAIGLIAISGPAWMFELWSRSLQMIAGEKIVVFIKRLSNYLIGVTVFAFLSIVGPLIYDLAKPGIEARLSSAHVEPLLP